MNRLNWWYLSLVVAAYMIGLGNIWKFPALLLKHGLGGLVVYMVMVVLMIPLIAVAMDSTKHKRYELLEYYLKEYNKPAFGFMFFLFDLILISYYTLVGGWTITSLFIKDVSSSFTGNLISLVLVFIILSLILLRGRERTLDIMVISVGLFFIAILFVVPVIHIKIGTLKVSYAASEWLKQAFAWRGITLDTVGDMAQQAAYSLSLGMGFYLILGEFLPENISPVKIAAIGAVLDTLASLIATYMITMILALNPGVPIEGTALLFKGLPNVLTYGLNAKFLLYLINVSIFLAALSSMIPIGETILRAYEELSKMDRDKAVPIVMGSAFVLGLLSIVGLNLVHVNTIGILDGAVSTFVLFGGIIAAWAVIERREYITKGLHEASYIGIIIIGILGLYSLYHLVISGQYVAVIVLITLIILSLGLNGYLRKFLTR
ncbi:sodium-dependent transporter [Thermococcus sp.]